MSYTPRILFVCTKFGGRSVLAAHLCNHLSPWGDIAVASSFDPGKLPASYFNFMQSLGYPIAEAQPLSLFEHYKKGQPFDHVIMMCSEISGEQCRIFGLSVQELYGKQATISNWSLPDLSLITGSPEQIKREFIRVVQQIEESTRQLIRELEHEIAAQGAGSVYPATPGVNQSAS